MLFFPKKVSVKLQKTDSRQPTITMLKWERLITCYSTAAGTAFLNTNRSNQAKNCTLVCGPDLRRKEELKDGKKTPISSIKKTRLNTVC